MVLFSEKGSMTFFSPSMPDWIKIINVSCSESNDFLFYTLICFYETFPLDDVSLVMVFNACKSSPEFLSVMSSSDQTVK